MAILGLILHLFRSAVAGTSVHQLKPAKGFLVSRDGAPMSLRSATPFSVCTTFNMVGSIGDNQHSSTRIWAVGDPTNHAAATLVAGG